MQPQPLVNVLSIAAVTLQWQSRGIATETLQPWKGWHIYYPALYRKSLVTSSVWERLRDADAGWRARIQECLCKLSWGVYSAMQVEKKVKWWEIHILPSLPLHLKTLTSLTCQLSMPTCQLCPWSCAPSSWSCPWLMTSFLIFPASAVTRCSVHDFSKYFRVHLLFEL